MTMTKRAMEIIVQDAVATLARVHNCDNQAIITNIQSGNAFLAKQLQELLTAGVDAVDSI
jgi:hypothetical protein